MSPVTQAGGALMRDRLERDSQDHRGRIRSASWPPRRGILKVAAVYVGLVIVPSLGAFAFLDAHRGKGRQVPPVTCSQSPAAPAALLGDGRQVPPVTASTSASSNPAVFTKLLLAVVIIVVGCAAVGAVLRRLGQPAVIGEIG